MERIFSQIELMRTVNVRYTWTVSVCVEKNISGTSNFVKKEVKTYLILSLHLFSNNIKIWWIFEFIIYSKLSVE